MDAVHLSAPKSRSEGGDTVVTCTVSLPGKAPQEVWIRLSGPAVADRADAFVALALVPAMRMGVPVVSEAPVSRTLLESGLAAVQHIYTIWSRDKYTGGRFRRVDIQAPIVDDLSPGPGSGLFFSGGVDSSFALLDEHEWVDRLIFIRDFEGQHSADDRTKGTAAVEKVAAAYGKQLILAETNARPLFAEYVSYLYQHGSHLAAVALELQGRVSTIRVPSSCDARIIAPFGSHPSLDPLWRTRATELIPGRIDITRFEKVAALAGNRVLLQNMRACWLPVHNCGNCHKCVRLMISLQALDRYEQGSPIDRPPLTPYQIARLPLTRNHEYEYYYEEIEDYLEDTGRHPELLEALRKASSGWYYSAVGQFFRGDLRRRVGGKVRRELGRWARR